MNAEPEHREDLELVGEVLAGRPAARRDFAARMRCVSRILAARNAQAGRPLSNEELADVAQDTLVLILDRLGDYAGRGALETWAYTFCSLEFLNAVRRKIRLRRRMSELPEEQTPEPPAVAPPPPEEGDLAQLLRHLTLREAQVVRLRHVEDHTFEEAAEALGMSVSSAKTHYYRALEKLRDVLTPGDAGGQG